jgi:hypothetical protein
MMEHTNSLRHEVHFLKHGFKNEPLHTVCLEIGQSFKGETNFIFPSDIVNIKTDFVLKIHINIVSKIKIFKINLLTNKINN